MIVLALKNVQKYYGANLILDDISFEIQERERVGIVGRNGTGKTTILKIIAGLEKQDMGDIAIKKDSTVGYLEQIPDYPENFFVSDVLNEAYKELNDIQSKMRSLERQMDDYKGNELETAVKRYGELQQLFEHKGGYSMNEMTDRVCTGLKIGDYMKQRPFSTLSGGEKTIVILAKILINSPDILLLDEPTNHLDIESMEWLESYLMGYRGSVIIVSHDRYFLDNIATGIIEFENMKAEVYMGNYSSYIQEKEIRLNLQLLNYKNQQKKIDAMEKTIKELRDWGNRGDNEKFFKRAANIKKRIDSMEKLQKPLLEKPKISADIDDDTRSGNDVVIVEDLKKGFDNNMILNGVNLHIRYGERVALIGNNGSGKSTLIKILLKEHSPDSGRADTGASVSIGYLPQNILFADGEDTVLELFRSDITISEGKAREYLAKFLFYGESVFRKVKNLSGGEKARLMLSKIMYHSVNFLILDEPTNHLDIDSRESLEEILQRFDGTILFISHDRYFINRISNSIVELKEGNLTIYQGNFEYYKYKKQETGTINVPKQLTSPKVKSKNPILNADSKRNTIMLNDIEMKIQDIESSIKGLDDEINNNSYEYEKLDLLYNQKINMQEELDALLEQWVDLQQ